MIKSSKPGSKSTGANLYNPRQNQVFNSSTPTRAPMAPQSPWFKPQTGQEQKTTESNSPTYTAQSTIKAPRYIQDGTTQDSINNTLAQGQSNADQRFQVKKLDRAGFSRGQGQNFMAAQEGVQQMHKAAGAAADVEASDQQTNSQMRSDYERAREMETQNNAMIQHNVAQSDWARNFAQQSLNAQLQMAQLQAQLQLRLALLR